MMIPFSFLVLLLACDTCIGVAHEGVPGVVEDLSAIVGYYADPTNPGCHVYIEFTSILSNHDERDTVTSSKRYKTSNKRGKKSENEGRQQLSGLGGKSISRRAVIMRNVRGDGEPMCFFNGSDSRLTPVPSVVQGGADSGVGLTYINITSDFSAEGGSTTRRGVLDRSTQPPQLVWDADSNHGVDTARLPQPLHTRAAQVWVQLPLTGFYQDPRYLRCRRQVTSETLSGALLLGADAKSQVDGCDGITDVMWQRPQHILVNGARVTVQYSRRYSYAEDLWQQMRALKREEANAMSGRALNDPMGDWWDQPGDQHGTLQYISRTIMWDDGVLWERHDGRMHDKPPSTARSSGPQLDQQQRHSSLSSNERRKLRVDELRATAARHSAAAAHKPSSNLKAKQQHVATSLLSPSAPIHGAGFAALSTSSEREDTGLGFTRDVANVDEL